MNLENEIIVTIDGRIQIITLNRPKNKNSFTNNMYLEVTKALQSSAEDDNIQVVVFTGTGSYFSVGHDFKQNKLTDRFEVLKNFFDCIIDYPKLLIGVVNGPALGVGCTILGLFDVVYCSDKAYFYTPFSKLGITMEGCSSYTFPKIFGRPKATDILLLNLKISAEEAYQSGFVTKIFTQRQIETVLWNKIGQIAKLPSEVIRQSKKLITNNEKDLLHKVNAKEIESLKRILFSRETQNNVRDIIIQSKL